MANVTIYKVLGTVDSPVGETEFTSPLPVSNISTTGFTINRDSGIDGTATFFALAIGYKA